MGDDTKPYIKEHDNKTICFADTLVQAKNALERKDLKEEEKNKLDGAHLMLFGVESWKKGDLKNFKGAMKSATNNFERFEIFGCEMKEPDQLQFGDLLEPEHLSSVKQFDLDNTQLEPKGAKAIFSKIAEVPSIEILNLQGSIGGKSPVMAAVADALVADSNIYKSLHKIDLKINELKPDAAQHVAKIIKSLANVSDEDKCEVDLFYNDIGADGATHIANALKDANSVVTHLDLCCNNIGDKGAEAIASMLRTNRTLKSLKLALNNIGNVGGIAICKALAPRSHDANKVQNKVLELLDMSANVWKEMESKKVDDNADAAVKAEAAKLDAELQKLEDPETGYPLEGKEEEYKKIQAVKDGLQYTENESQPLAEAISNVCTASYLKEFDFTGVEFSNEGWETVGHNLSTTNNEALQKHDEPMTIRFSIVDLMNENNLKTMEKFIWGDAKDAGSPYHRYKHIDWRRRDDDKKDA